MDKYNSSKANKRFLFRIRNHRWLQIGFTFFILVGAAWNYSDTNSCIKDQYCFASNILAKLDTLSRENITDTTYNLSKISKDSIQNTLFESSPSTKMFHDATHIFEKILYEMEMSKKKIFDSNTITFLISFVLVGLIAIFFENDKKVTDKIKEIDQLHKSIEKKILSSQIHLNEFQKKIKEDQQIIQFINDLQSIRLISIQIYLELVQPTINLEGPLNEYARIIDSEIENLIHVLNSGSLNCIAPNRKETLLKILNKIITFVSSDNLLNPDENAVPITLRTAQSHLQELYQRIDELCVYTPRRSRFSI